MHVSIIHDAVTRTIMFIIDVAATAAVIRLVYEPIARIYRPTPLQISSRDSP